MTRPRYDGKQKCPCCTHEFDPTMHVERVRVAELGDYMDRKDDERRAPWWRVLRGYALNFAGLAWEVRGQVLICAVLASAIAYVISHPAFGIVN